MKRIAYNDLVNWKNNPDRKPLLVQGARQVGKTYLINTFGETEFNDFVYLNFELNPDLNTLFSGELSPKKIIENISLYIGRKVKSNNTLIFFDEIQIIPKALTSLKYFYEQAPEYYIVAAGSLLGVSVGKPSSFPVGKVNFLTLYPMTFYEYLLAINETLLAAKINDCSKVESLPDLIHNKLTNHLKKYLFLGGMPEVIARYLSTNDIVIARNTQNEILEAYKRDFSKYTKKTQSIKTLEVWQSIPSQLAKENKKFKYSSVQKKARSSTFEQTIEWLRSAGLINVVSQISTPKLPLSGYADNSKFKVYLFDTGLLGAMLNIPSRIIVEPTGIFSEYNGAFIENYIAQEFSALSNNPLYYWTSKSEAEVDFILQIKGEIYPVEVKSGYNRNIKSLRSYSTKFNPKVIFRASPRNFAQSGSFINIPLYAGYLIAKTQFD